MAPNVRSAQLCYQIFHNRLNRIGSMGDMARPVDTGCAGQTGHEVEIFRTGEVRDVTAVSDYEHRGFEAPFDADEQRSQCASTSPERGNICSV